MSRIAHCAVALAAAGGILAMGMPDADAARSASLAESRLIEDQNDAYLFPQVGVEYSQMLSLDYGLSPEQGSGLVLLGDEAMTYGFGVFQGDVLDQRQFFPHGAPHDSRLGNVSNPIGQSPQPHTAVDGFFSTDMDGMQLGGRLTLGTGGDRTVTPDDEPITNTQNFGALSLGFSMVNDLRVDASLNTYFSLGAHDDGTQEDDNLVRQGAGSGFGVGASARAFIPMEEGVEVGALTDIYFDRTSWEDFPHEADMHQQYARNAFSMLGGAGPVYNIPDTDTTLATYGVIGYLFESEDPDVHGDDRSTRQFGSSFVIPGVHAAADIELFEWLFFRTGAQYNFAFATDGQDVEEGTRANQYTRNRLSQFGWRAGLGVEVDAFSFDGVFQDGFITGGPDFIGDPGGGMFSMVSATYEF